MRTLQCRDTECSGSDSRLVTCAHCMANMLHSSHTFVTFTLLLLSLTLITAQQSEPCSVTVASFNTTAAPNASTTTSAVNRYLDICLTVNTSTIPTYLKYSCSSSGQVYKQQYLSGNDMCIGNGWLTQTFDSPHCEGEVYIDCGQRNAAASSIADVSTYTLFIVAVLTLLLSGCS